MFTKLFSDTSALAIGNVCTNSKNELKLTIQTQLICPFKRSVGYRLIKTILILICRSQHGT